MFREEMADLGLRIDNAEDVDAAREDMRFIRRLRRSWDGAAGKVGNAVLIGVTSAGLAILGAGFWAWLGSGPK